MRKTHHWYWFAVDVENHSELSKEFEDMTAARRYVNSLLQSYSSNEISFYGSAFFDV